MDHPRPWMRYVAADDLDDPSLDFDGLDVESAAGDKLGDVDGFIIDVNSGRPYYVVVDAGGWFRSRDYLLPIGHARLDRQREVLVADLTRDRIEKFPGFDKDQFEKLSDSELDRFGKDTAAACCEGDAAMSTSQSWHERPHYNQPNWWQTGYYRPERMVAHDAARPASEPSTRRQVPIEQVSARESASPVTGRAKPGDVIGVETGGEQTHVGDTPEEERERLRKAEKERQR